MPSYEKEKIEKMLQKMFPHLWGKSEESVLSQEDIDKNIIYCAEIAKFPIELSGMIKRFRRTFE